MRQKETKTKSGFDDKKGVDESKPVRVRLPGFIKDEEVGLGDFIMRVTSSAGITPCGGCHRRATWLNRRFHITG